MLTRRDFMAELAIAGAVACALPAGIAVPGQAAARAAVVAIHMDQPYLDATGRALPYRPPAGVRAGAPVAHLSDEEFRRAQPYA
jgi:hypothetical protein